MVDFLIVINGNSSEAFSDIKYVVSGDIEGVGYIAKCEPLYDTLKVFSGGSGDISILYSNSELIHTPV